jgi:hypothetical protein
MKDLKSTLDRLVAQLERLSIEYVIMGGLAVRAYSIPRATEDIDFTLALDRDRLPELFDALESENYTIPEPYRSGWVDDVKGLKLVKLKRYVVGHGIDVDLFLAESPFQDEVLRRKCLADVEGRRYWIASPEDLVLLKLVAGRPRDLIDVADVLFTQGQLDVEYMERWADELGVKTDLQRALDTPFER